MEAMQLEPMSVGRILDRTFVIYRNNFLRFITIVAIIQVPIALLSLVSSSFLWSGFPQEPRTASDSPEETTQDSPEAGDEAERTTRFPAPPARMTGRSSRPPILGVFGCLGTVVAFLLAMIGGMLSQAALAKGVSEAYLGREITVGQAYRTILPRFLSLLGAAISVTLVVWLGLILCIVPGVIFALWFFLTTPCVVVEGCRAMDGMSRSRALVSGNLGKAFVVGFVALLITWVVAMPLSFIGSFAGTMLARNNPVLGMSIRHLTSLASQIVATPIGAAASILLYYDLRIRKEGFDLQMLAQNTGSGQG
jgi:hypothetical protein